MSVLPVARVAALVDGSHGRVEVLEHRTERPAYTSEDAAAAPPQNRAAREPLPHWVRAGRGDAAAATTGLPQNRRPTRPDPVPVTRPDHQRAWQ